MTKDEHGNPHEPALSRQPASRGPWRERHWLEPLGRVEFRSDRYKYNAEVSAKIRYSLIPCASAFITLANGTVSTDPSRRV